MGSAYDFETDKNYNFDNAISMEIELGKTCFSPAESVSGSIILKPKEGTKANILQNPTAVLSLTQYSFYTYNVQEIDPKSHKKHNINKEANEIDNLLNLPLNLTNYKDAEINSILKIPFSFKIPLNAYPSCFFEEKIYVKHYLCINFSSINAKKTLIIVIKNPPYFNIYNKLYQSPSICYKVMDKNKLGVFSQGSFNASLKLQKNAFTYQEVIPFEIDIDLSLLSLNVKHIRIYIRRDSRRNKQVEHTYLYRPQTDIIAKKEIPFKQTQRKIHITNTISLEGNKNPLNIYRQLDSDKRKISKKFSGINLYPTCAGGLLGVDYFIKMELVMDSFLSSPEEFQLPIDIYEPFANQPNMNNEQNMSSSNQSLLNTQPLQHQYSNSQRTEPRQNNQINPLPMM